MHPAATPASPDAQRVPWWLRLHRALMPDYNRKAAVYWWCGVLLGAAAIFHAGGVLAAHASGNRMEILAGIVIAMVAGLFPVRVPRSKNSFAAGEIFIFLLLLLYGPAAAVLASAGEGLIGSWRTSKRWTSRIATPAMASLAMLASGSLLHAVIGAARAHGMANAGVLLVATMASAVLYFALNTTFVAAVPYLKRSEWPDLRELFGNFGWVGLTFAGSASVACLLYLSFEQAGFAVLLGAVPVIAMLLTAIHSLFRQQETDEARRQERVSHAEREAEVTARHMRELEVSERRFHNAFSHASIGMALVSFDARVLQINPALCRLVGAPDDGSMLRRPISGLVAEEHVAELHDKLIQLNAQQSESFELELQLRHREGAEVWALVHGSVFDDQDAASPCLILQVQDVTARRRAEAGLHQIAFHDALTGLPNRRRFLEQLTQALERVQRDRRHHFALMFLDFDRFKMINDSLGHAVGDEFLIAVGRRIQQQVRPHDIVARLGGDEFAIIAEDLDNGRYAVALAGGVLTRCASRSSSAAPRSPPARASASRSATWATRTRPTCCATPTPRCTRPRTRARRATPSSTPRCTPRWRSACASRVSCGVRSPRAACRWSTSRSSTWRAGAPPASRRSRAGSTPSSAPSARAPSSRWPRSRA